jgi:hypothetical protein
MGATLRPNQTASFVETDPPSIAHTQAVMAKLKALVEDRRAPIQERRRAWEKWHALNARLPKRPPPTATYDRPFTAPPRASAAGPSPPPSAVRYSARTSEKPPPAWHGVVKFWLFMVFLEFVLRYVGAEVR